MTLKTQNIITDSWNESSDKLLRFIQSKVHQKEDAEDILQEVFIKSISKVGSIKPNSNLNAWLFTVTKNAINDYFRKNKKAIKSQLVEELLEDKSDQFNGHDAFCCLEPHINDLPEKYKMVITLSEIEGKKHKEIAESLSLSLSAIKSRVVRGREMLKEKFISCCKFHLDKNGKLTGDPDCNRGQCSH
jgi:RNA polymerase sigma-70 factor (ECF subfamily)